ncbi:MAG TPA: hypothetical protein VMV72_09415 [Verrucomicrobiae bacterium]|nr:hypothetical protein [Verrucomicrobiae bacterium]
MILGGSTGLTVAHALALPYLVVVGTGSDYYMNASPPYHSSFVFKSIQAGCAILPPVDLIPGLFLVVRVWGSTMKFNQYENSAMYGELVHIGGTVGATDHVNAVGERVYLQSGCGFVLVSTGSVWMLLNSFAAPGVYS